MNQKTNIVLIGMPAVGKSTVGLVLAETLHCSFMDTDLYIKEREGCDLREIIAREGLEGFCRREEQHVMSIKTENTVISTGGSVVYGEKAMAHLKETGYIVYLVADIHILKSRLDDPEKRGVVRKPGQSFESLLEERDALYRQYADFIVFCPSGETPSATAARVVQKLP